MSIASATTTIKYIQKSGTYSAQLMSPDGDIYQMYRNNGTYVFSPDIDGVTVTKSLRFVCISSRTSEGVSGVVTPSGIDWYVNGTKLTFTAGLSTNLFNGKTGHFQIVHVDVNNSYEALKIVKNLAEDFSFAPITIKGVGIITNANGTSSDSIQATYTIPVYPATGDTAKVSIVSLDNKNFTITEKGGSCVLTAKAYNFDGEITSTLDNPLTYVWEKLTPTGWEVLSEITDTLTVTDAMVDSSGQFRVTINRIGSPIGKDIQNVLDASDPYIINPNPKPVDETLYDTDPDTTAIIYAPKVYRRGQQTEAAGFTFTYFVRGTAGEQINASTTDPKVTVAMCKQVGGDVALEIFAEPTV